MGFELIPSLIGGASSVASGIKGKGAANEANQRQSEQDRRFEEIFSTGMGQLQGMQDQANQFLAGTGDATRLMEQAQSGGQGLSNTLTDLAAQLMGANPSYDFESGRTTAGQAMDDALAFGDRTRNQAQDQAATAFRSQSDALDAALASRGLSRGSGVASGALADIARTNSQQMAGLNRDIANQQANQAMQATQFDIGTGLQYDQLGSNFALGSAAQQAQNLGMAGDMATQAYVTPLSTQQQMYQQNQLSPFLAMTGMSNPMQFIEMALTGFGQGTAQAGANAAQGGAGFGAGMGSLTSNMWDYLSNKNTGGTTGATTNTPNTPSGWGGYGYGF